MSRWASRIHAFGLYNASQVSNCNNSGNWVTVASKKSSESEIWMWGNRSVLIHMEQYKSWASYKNETHLSSHVTIIRYPVDASKFRM